MCGHRYGGVRWSGYGCEDVVILKRSTEYGVNKKQESRIFGKFEVSD